MTKSYIVDLTYNGMRIDRFLRNKLGKVPQSLLEKGLRSGTIKVNKKTGWVSRRCKACAREYTRNYTKKNKQKS